MNVIWALFSIFYLICCGCSAPGVIANLGYHQERRVVVIGEHVSQDIAVYYQRRYDAMVWFTPPSQSRFKDSWQAFYNKLEPSQPMRSLINELVSINFTMGHWEIIIPKVGEGYFLDTLRHMSAGSLAHARGNFVLTDSKGNKAMEAQAARVTSGSFFVTYEGQKYNY